MPRRYYSSTAGRTTLASGVTDSATSFSVVAVSGWPSSFPYTLIIDQDTVNEEIVQVTARSGTSLTVVRAVDGTTGVAHSAGAAVNHGVSARDFDEPNAHIESTSNPHSVTAAQAGALALAGGTVTGPTVVDVNSASTALRITQVGAGNALVVEDSANPDSSAFVVDSNGSVFIGPSTGIIALNVAVPAASKGVSFDYDEVTDRTVIASIHQGVSFKPLALQGSELVFEPGATERMRITSTGNVGIGTSAPNHPLQVKTTTDLQGIFQEHVGDSGVARFTAFRSRANGAAVQDGDIISRFQSTTSVGGGVFPTLAFIEMAMNGTVSSTSAPSRVSIFTTPSGSVSPSERMRIDNAGLITGTGTSLGAWTAFTPTVSGITIGNGSITAAYSVIGKTCFARYDLTFGSTTTVGGSSNGFTLPLTMKSGQYATVIPFYFDASLTASYHGFGQTTSNYIYFDATNNANGKAENITTTTPFTWATSDRIIVSVVYEIA